MFGFGSRNPQMRTMRVALLAVVLFAGFAFHDHGTAYTTIRVIYYIVILGVVLFAVSRRSMAKRRGTSVPGAPPGPGPSPTVPGTAWPPPSPIQNPGWYPDQQDMKVQRYWDGAAFTSTRHWAGHEWVKPDPNPPNAAPGPDLPR